MSIDGASAARKRGAAVTVRAHTIGALQSAPERTMVRECAPAAKSGACIEPGKVTLPNVAKGAHGAEQVLEERSEYILPEVVLVETRAS